MRIAATRFLFSRSSTLSCYAHQRAAVRLISRASFAAHRRRHNSTLAAETSRTAEADITLQHKASDQQSPFTSQGGALSSRLTGDRSLTPLTAPALTPLDQYRRLVDSGALKPDDHQTRIIQRLQRLHDDLATYDPPPIPRSSPSLSLVRLPFCSIYNIFTAI